MRSKLIERRIGKSGETRTVTTTLAELIAAIQDEVSHSEDDVVVEVATHLFHTRRVKYASR